MSRTITSGFGTHRKLTICYNDRTDVVSISQMHPVKDNQNIKFRKDCMNRFIEMLKEVVGND